MAITWNTADRGWHRGEREARITEVLELAATMCRALVCALLPAVLPSLGPAESARTGADPVRQLPTERFRPAA